MQKKNVCPYPKITAFGVLWCNLFECCGYLLLWTTLELPLYPLKEDKCRGKIAREALLGHHSQCKSGHTNGHKAAEINGCVVTALAYSSLTYLSLWVRGHLFTSGVLMTPQRLYCPSPSERDTSNTPRTRPSLSNRNAYVVLKETYQETRSESQNLETICFSTYYGHQNL